MGKILLEVTMIDPDWVSESPLAVSVCDVQGMLLSMNTREAALLADMGGEENLGKNIYDCHNALSCAMLDEMLSQQKGEVYTVEENGKTELVIHAPWYQDGRFSGLVEIVLELGGPIPHIRR